MSHSSRLVQNDRKIRQIDRLVRSRFEQVVKWMETYGWQPWVAETRRSRARQLYLRTRGLSKVLHSKHQDGHAMDVISALHAWPDTPIAFMADLAIAAKEEGLATGLMWGMKPEFKYSLTQALNHGYRNQLVEFIAEYGHGWDPCHVEVP